MSIDLDAFAETLAQELQGYAKETAAQVKKAVDKTAEKANEMVKANSTFGGKGAYKKAMTLTVSYESGYEKRITWHLKGTRYRLAHLLEHGHKTRAGGMTRAYPHIVRGEQYVQANLSKNIAEEMESEH